MTPRAPEAIPLGGDEERLLIEAAKADPRRFAELYERHFDRVYAFVARRAADRGEAEDVTSAFGAGQVAAHHEPDGRLAHAIVRLGASAIEMGEAHDQWGPMPTMFYAYVDDVDAWYRRALDAGATSIEAPALQPYGERRAAVRDRFDNQ